MRIECNIPLPRNLKEKKMKSQKEILKMMQELTAHAKEAGIPMIISAEIDNNIHTSISGTRLEILGLASNVQVELTRRIISKGLLHG